MVRDKVASRLSMHVAMRRRRQHHALKCAQRGGGHTAAVAAAAAEAAAAAAAAKNPGRTPGGSRTQTKHTPMQSSCGVEGLRWERRESPKIRAFLVTPSEREAIAQPGAPETVATRQRSGISHRPQPRAVQRSVRQLLHGPDSEAAASSNFRPAWPRRMQLLLTKGWTSRKHCSTPRATRGCASAVKSSSSRRQQLPAAANSQQRLPTASSAPDRGHPAPLLRAAERLAAAGAVVLDTRRHLR